MSLQSLFEHTKQVLEWPVLLEKLASLTYSSLGAEHCRKLPFEQDYRLAQIRLNETSEMLSLHSSITPFPKLIFSNIENSLLRAEKNASLESKELRDIAQIIKLGEQVRNCLTINQVMLTNLRIYKDQLHDLSFLRTEIDLCVNQEGEIIESATPVLFEAIQETRRIKEHMRERLESMLSSMQYREIIQENYFAERDNRYVIPIKAEKQKEIHGIVHDVSSSGATVFVEPRELIDLNNRIKIAKLQVTREINRILRELTVLVQNYLEFLRNHLKTLTILDCIYAKATLSQIMEGKNVTLNGKGHVKLYNARHPLLILTKDHVISNDIVFEKQQNVLVITGPNTGGKTVILKLLGLFSLMARTGLHLPCNIESEMGFFSETYADIGDTQDLAKDLSSFSAHLIKIIELLEIAQCSNLTDPPSLVLLDEVISSTDPIEGAALAEAILIRLANLGLKVVVTTHYNSLKVLAVTNPRFLNASVGFNVNTLTPTYRLMQGIPGGSSALIIASRLGMDSNILTQAANLIHQEDQQLSHIFEELQKTKHSLYEELELANSERRTAERDASEAHLIAERMRTTENEEIKKFNRKLKDELSRARLEIRQALDSFRKDKTSINAKETKKHLLNIEEDMYCITHAGEESISLDTLNVGSLVEISNMGTIGRLLEEPKDKKRVRVQVGETELSVAVELLTGKCSGNESFQSKFKDTDLDSHIKQEQKKRGHSSLTTQSCRAMTIDLRGQDVEHAIACLTKQLDRALMMSSDTLRVIHGYGTGKLKGEIRRYLSRSPYVKSFHFGEQEEGRDGVTIVELR